MAGFDADLKDMREDTTNEARDFIKHNKKMQEALFTVLNSKGGVRAKGQMLKAYSEAYANGHNGNFGELFVAELDLVYWQRLVKEFEV